MNTFGGSDETDLDSLTTAMLQGLIAGRQALQPVMNGIGTAVGQALDESGRPIQQIASKLQRAVNSGVSASGKRLNGIASALATNVAAQVGEIGATLAPIAGAAMLSPAHAAIADPVGDAYGTLPYSRSMPIPDSAIAIPHAGPTVGYDTPAPIHEMPAFRAPSQTPTMPGGMPPGMNPPSGQPTGGAIPEPPCGATLMTPIAGVYTVPANPSMQFPAGMPDDTAHDRSVMCLLTYAGGFGGTSWFHSARPNTTFSTNMPTALVSYMDVPAGFFVGFDPARTPCCYTFRAGAMPPPGSPPAPSPPPLPPASPPSAPPSPPPSNPPAPVPTPGQSPPDAIHPDPHKKPAPQPVAPLECNPNITAISFPLPGTRDWCLAANDIRDALSWMGNSILDLAMSAVQSAGQTTEAWQQLPDPSFSSPLSLLGDLWTLIKRGLGAVGTPAFPALYQGLCAIRNGALKVGTCSPHVMVGIAVVKATISILKRFRGGSDALVWATVDITLEFPAIEMSIDYFLNSLCPVEIPQIPETMECKVRNTIDDDTYACWMLMRGADPTLFQPVLRARRENLTAEEVIQLSRRYYDATQLTDSIILADDNNRVIQATPADAVAFRMLTYLGWMEPSERWSKIVLYDEIPGIADHLHWLQRNVFDTEYVRDYNLMEGFDTRFWPRFGGQLRAVGMTLDTAELHYAAHWIQPSPGQLAEMLQRLRPGRVDPRVQFTEVDYLRMLAEQDVAPYFRERFRATAYSVFGLRFLRQLYDTRQIDDAEASQRFQDLGYKAADADTLVRSETIRRARTVATQTQGYTVANVHKLYIAMKLSSDEVIAHLADIGYPMEVAQLAMRAWRQLDTLKVADNGSKAARAKLIAGIKEALEVGVMDAGMAIQVLLTAGWSQEAAASYVGSLVAADNIRSIRIAIKHIAKGVKDGRVSLLDAGNLLQGMGIIPAKVQWYMSQWETELESGGKELSLGQIRDFVSKGMMPVAVARQRIANLGYDDPDAELIVAEAENRLLATEEKAVAAEDKAKAAQAKAIQDTIKRNAAQLKALQDRLARLVPVKQLMDWFREGVVGANYLTARLLALGYAPSDIANMIEEATIKGGVKRGKTPITPLSQPAQ